MSHVVRLWGRHSSRRPAPPRFDLEVLEGRTLLSGTGASPAAKVSSITVLTASLPTAVTGADEVFTATPENAADGSPIPSGKITFVVEAPQKIVLGTVKVNKSGQASISTDQLTKIATYQVKAEYTPTIPQVSASVSASLGVKVIPQPLHVPIAVNLEVGAPQGRIGPEGPIARDCDGRGHGQPGGCGKGAADLRHHRVVRQFAPPNRPGASRSQPDDGQHSLIDPLGHRVDLRPVEPANRVQGDAASLHRDG